MLIVLAIIAVTLFVVYVLIPSVLFLIHYVVFWIVIGATVAYRAATKRPWIVEMEEADGFRVRAWRIVGWQASKRVIDQVADAIRRGEDPVPEGAEPVEIVNLAEAA